MSMCTAGILLIIGLGVAFGVALGVMLLFGLLTCFRRYVGAYTLARIAPILKEMAVAPLTEIPREDHSKWGLLH